MSNRFLRFSILALFVFSAVAWGIREFASAQVNPLVRDPSLLRRPLPISLWATDPNPAMNDPDKFNWQLFTQINAPVADQTQIPNPHGGAPLTSNNVFWETWADDELTFPANPKISAPPVWPGAQPHSLRLRPPVQQRLRRQFLMNANGGRVPLIEINAPGSEEVRRNQAAFDFIVTNKLWYTQGLAAAFASTKPISFPFNAVEIKARWKQLGPNDDKTQYHWNYDEQGNVYGLIALHIISKAVPNWTWATWEWVGNAGRGDYIGCHDSFGVTPHDLAPNTTLNQVYPAGQLTPALLAMFTAGKLSPEWQNYRLKGSQLNFTDSTGRTTLLGNSVTEFNFVSSSSCITCHSQASVDANGGLKPGSGFTASGSSNGTPQPSWFYDTSTNPWTKKFQQIDFIWGIQAASPATP
jgi:hypothetical protein